MISARRGWLSAELTVGAEDTPLVMDSIKAADIEKIDLEDIAHIHVADCEDEWDLAHFVLAMDVDDLIQICRDECLAVVRDDFNAVLRARAELRRTTLGRGRIIHLRCHHLSIEDRATAAALRAALAARAGWFSHGSQLTVWAPPAPPSS